MKRVLALTCLTLTLWTPAALAQSLSDRISAVREQRRQAEQRQQEHLEAQVQESLQIPRKMGVIIDDVFIDQTSAEDAFNWWSERTGIPLVINWGAMELEGIDREQIITLDLKTVPARLLLEVLIRQASPHIELIYEVTPWYVQVTTKRQANRHPVMRVYDVSDMVMRIPNFTHAPRLNLTDALSNTSSGGGGGGSGGSGGQIFGDNDDAEEEDLPTKTESGQNLADMIRNTIEPDIWQTNGGQFSSLRYYNGRLIVNAPKYVHKQIGIPVVQSVDSNRDRVLPPRGNHVGGTAAPDSNEPFGKQ